MLERYRQLDEAPTDVAVHVHAVQQLRLDPKGRDATRRMRATASAFYAAQFGMFAFSYSEDVTLTATEDSPHFWLPVPVDPANGGTVAARRRTCRIAMPTRQDPLHLSGGDAYLGLAIPGDDMLEFADHVLDRRGPQLTDGMRSFDLDHPPHMAAARLVVEMMHIDAKDPSFLSDVTRVRTYLEPIMALVVSGACCLDEEIRPPKPRDVKRAVDYIEANLAHPITLSDLSQVANVPIRTLSAHFNLAFGMSPMAYVATRRIDRAHEMLVSGRVSRVTEAAINMGLSHFGRFSKSYRERYGERPSETLARSRRRLS